MSTALVTLSPVVTADQVTGRQLTIVVTPAGSTTPNAPIMLSLSPSTTTYSLTCNPGDTVQATDADTNIVGTSAPGTATETAPLAPPTAVPTTPTVGITFS